MGNSKYVDVLQRRKSTDWETFKLYTNRTYPWECGENHTAKPDIVYM